MVGYGSLVAATLITLGQLVCFAPLLPEAVAGHFGEDGLANGWMKKTSLLTIHIAVQFGTAGVLLLAGEFARRLPDSLFNMPNKEYWLHPHRRDETLSDNGKALILIAGATSLFFTAVMQLVYVANLSDPPKLDERFFLIAFGAYLGIVLGVVIFMVRKYSRIPSDVVA